MKIWPANNDLLSVAELQLLWEDKVRHIDDDEGDDDGDDGDDEDDDDDDDDHRDDDDDRSDCKVDMQQRENAAILMKYCVLFILLWFSH